MQVTKAKELKQDTDDSNIQKKIFESKETIQSIVKISEKFYRHLTVPSRNDFEEDGKATFENGKVRLQPLIEARVETQKQGNL